MNPILAQILLSLFYLAVFIVAASALTGCICRVIHEVYASKTTMAHLIARDQAPEHDKSFV